MTSTDHTPRRPNGRIGRDARRLQAELKNRVQAAAAALRDLEDGCIDYRARYGMNPAVARSIDHQAVNVRAALTTLAASVSGLEDDRMAILAAMNRHPSAPSTDRTNR